MKINSNLLIILFGCFGVSFAQNTVLLGTVTGEDSVENIHVINRTQNINTTTSAKGTFKIEAKENDTLIFKSLNYKLVKFKLSKQDIVEKAITVNLMLNINVLPEAQIGFSLSGNLTDDVSNSNAKPGINFYDLGIPGYTGKQKTKRERILYEATSGGGILALNPIINAITGRTKRLKKHIALEENTMLMNRVKDKLSEVFFKANPLDEAYRTEFFYFCAEDKNFKARCSTNDFETLLFLKEKYIEYKKNRGAKE